MEMRLPLILGLNAKVVCSPEGLTFRPKVTGSITQKQLKAKLQAKLAADPMLDIDVNRALEVSDLIVSDLTASIGIELPKKWTERFQSKASFKRVTKALAEVTESSENGSGNGSDTPSNGGGTSSSGSTTGGDNNGGENTDPEG